MNYFDGSDDGSWTHYSDMQACARVGQVRDQPMLVKVLAIDGVPCETPKFLRLSAHAYAELEEWVKSLD